MNDLKRRKREKVTIVQSDPYKLPKGFVFCQHIGCKKAKPIPEMIKFEGLYFDSETCLLTFYENNKDFFKPLPKRIFAREKAGRKKGWKLLEEGVVV